jgi:hypothetical protein
MLPSAKQLFSFSINTILTELLHPPPLPEHNHGTVNSDGRYASTLLVIIKPKPPHSSPVPRPSTAAFVALHLFIWRVYSLLFHQRILPSAPKPSRRSSFASKVSYPSPPTGTTVNIIAGSPPINCDVGGSASVCWEALRPSFHRLLCRLHRRGRAPPSPRSPPISSSAHQFHH